jgi:predicted metal-dependent HD superfamily phosphohydrolase
MGLVGFEGWEDEVIHMVPLPVFNRIEAMQQRIDIEQLGKKWNALCERIEAKSNQTLVFQDLIKRYREDHRKYHTLQHIKTCLNEFEIARFLAQQPDALMTALFFHDVIYEGNKNQPGNKFDDEGNSAEYARIILTKQLKINDNFANTVASLIVDTKHSSIHTNIDSKLMVDIDLAILGRSQRLFERYEKLIRQEYSWVSESDFTAERVKIISKFLPPHRPTIYQTPFFQKRYEQQAINNLNRSISNLTRAK